MNNDIISTIRERLQQNADEEARIASQHFSKEPVKSYGVKTPTVRQLSKRIFKRLNSRTKAEIFDLCDTLWQSGYLEESIIACDWSFYLRKKYEPGDFLRFRNWVDLYVNNWASCDTLSNHTIGEFIEMYPRYLPELKNFARSENRWMRRSAAVSLIVPARKGKFLTNIFEIADLLLIDKDDLVQKGYGWLLKTASVPYQQEVFDYVMDRKTVMPRTALRYAIEKMPKVLKKQAMAK